MADACSSRRGLFRGASGLVALTVVGCPKPSPELPVMVVDLLAGLPITEAALVAAVRAMQAAPLSEGLLMVQRRRVTMATRTLDGPTFDREDVCGMTVSVERASGPSEVASSRVDDGMLASLLQWQGIEPVPVSSEGSVDGASPLKPVPGQGAVEELTDLTTVGGALALMLEALQAGTPQAVTVCWEGVEDDRLLVDRDGQVRRALRRHERITVEASFAVPTGTRRLVWELPRELLWAPEPATAIAEACAALLVEAGAQAAAVEPTGQMVTIELQPMVGLVLLGAAASASGGSKRGWQRARFDDPLAGFVDLPPVSMEQTVVESEPIHAGVRVHALASPPVSGTDGSFRLIVSNADLVDVNGTRPLAAGSVLRVTAEALATPRRVVLEKPARSLRAEHLGRATTRIEESGLGQELRSAVVGLPGQTILVGHQMPSLRLHGCELEAFDGV